jgi:hypothetical protein
MRRSELVEQCNTEIEVNEMTTDGKFLPSEGIHNWMQRLAALLGYTRRNRARVSCYEIDAVHV